MTKQDRSVFAELDYETLCTLSGESLFNFYINLTRYAEEDELNDHDRRTLERVVSALMSRTLPEKYGLLRKLNQYRREIYKRDFLEQGHEERSYDGLVDYSKIQKMARQR